MGASNSVPMNVDLRVNGTNRIVNPYNNGYGKRGLFDISYYKIGNTSNLPIDVATKYCADNLTASPTYKNSVAAAGTLAGGGALISLPVLGVGALTALPLSIFIATEQGDCVSNAHQGYRIATNGVIYPYQTDTL